MKYLKNLVAFDTQSSKSNLALIGFCQKVFKKNGYEVRVWGKGEKANLFAYKPAYGKRIVLAAHSDTVPPAVGWKSDPYTLIQKNDSLTGLGVSDMKTFIAIMLELSSTKPAQNLAFLLTYNEESDFEGASLVRRKIIGKSDTLIIGEPTEGKVYCESKGLAVYDLCFIGKGGHGSEPGKGVSSIMAAAQFICDLQKEFNSFKEDYGCNDFANPEPTLNIGLISGGEAKNIIPVKTNLSFELRTTMQDCELDFDKILNELMQKSPCKTRLKKSLSLPPFISSPGIKKIFGKRLIAKGPSYCTEANILSLLCPSTIICGPGNIEQAHKAEESITLQEIAQYREVLTRIINML